MEDRGFSLSTGFLGGDVSRQAKQIGAIHPPAPWAHHVTLLSASVPCTTAPFHTHTLEDVLWNPEITWKSFIISEQGLLLLPQRLLPASLLKTLSASLVSLSSHRRLFLLKNPSILKPLQQILRGTLAHFALARM